MPHEHMLNFEPIVRDPIKQAYLVHEASINALRTIGYFLGAVVAIFVRAGNIPSDRLPSPIPIA